MPNQKSTPDQIRQRFDNDVERFSNLETGQAATVDAVHSMSLIAKAAAVSTPNAKSILDIGCGAGNYTLKLLEQIPNLNVQLVDLSQPMLDRAKERIGKVTNGEINVTRGDIREQNFEDQQFEIILAASVLHHLRTDDEWQTLFENFYRWLKPGGSVWIFDLIESSTEPVQTLMRETYGEYLVELKDEEYRDLVFSYIEEEDTPRPLMEQLNRLQNVGFKQVEILHKNSCFAAFGAVK